MEQLIGGQGHRDIIYFKRFFEGQSDLSFYNMFKFSFVRNPYTRFVSSYQWAMENYDEWKDININDFALNLKENYKTWENRSLKALLFRPQYKFLCNQYYDIQVDFVGKLENVNDDWSYVASKIGVSKDLPHINKSKKDKPILTSHTKEIIKELYGEDFKIFGYEV